ncbi:olfactomedin-like protein 2B isoform X4 [Bos indicus x Bos taurus]|uniref:olfactomedin-like protein 2B isoform X3 n=1 Tax=Bos taurus TaxID=9913 RepID=UPI000383E383|nr:olfactomedin-like protein 2B isoform X3 [Bos taurus]XP_027383256.1 olfactomedin-like protein 2B isoform X4 [Bos indicus x Bos taurus]
MAKSLLLVLCFALVTTLGWGYSAPPTGTTEPPDVQTVAPTEDETLQNEADNQENVLSQLLGDYDKVKAVSEGSDCQCKCVVRPLGRDACQRVNAGTSRKEDFYTVETITSGPSCKCACVAPPSALNPCEGDFRLQKLREADSRDLKLSTIIDMLEGAFYGLDLLKLHSVTTKLVGRVDKLEEEISKNLTKENEQIREDVEEIRTEMNKRGKENCSNNILDSIPDIRSALQRDAAAAYTHPEIKSIKLLQTRPLAPPEVVKPQRPLQRQVHLRGRPASRPTVIRGITYYKAKDPEEENDIEEHQDEFFSGEHGMDLLIEDQLLRHNQLLTSATRRPAATGRSAAVTADAGTTSAGTPTTALPSARLPASTAAPSTPDPAVSASVEQFSTPLPTTSVSPDPTEEAVPTPFTQVPATTVAHTATQQPPASAPPSAAPEDAFVEATHTAPVPPPPVRTDSPGKDSTARQGTVPPGPTLSPEEEDDIRNVIGRCKDTLSTITGPITQNTYGRNEGAWMKDPLAKDERIYVTNYYYGNTLVEFRNLENFKQGRWSNSYKLPYSWIGTGHVVYNGAFYYNRAFTRNIIKYDLKQRYVAAWAMLHDVAYEEATPWRWQGHSDVDFAVDENGLWLIYPALDDEGFSQEVIVLSKLNAVDLSTQKETTWRTGLRRNLYGNCFVICGVLYAVDSHNQRNANISYAFDTHTNTQIVPRLLFENEYSYTTQIDYNPKDRLLYAWDNGHQVTYHVIFAY